MRLYLVSNLDLALEIKLKESCPHIHFIIEPDCDPFTESMVWLEVLCRGRSLAVKEGCCIVSYMDFSQCKGSLSEDDLEMIKEGHKKINERYPQVEVISL